MSEIVEQLLGEAALPDDTWRWNGYTQDELRCAFEDVQNAEHWKGPIDAVIIENVAAVTYWAIVFYTATDPQVEYREETGQFRVTSEGYWAGPAGP
jgi:hypothetical protein